MRTRNVRASMGRVGMLVLALSLALQLSADPPAPEWPQFRGAHRDGISAETGLIDGWGENGPAEAWRRPLGDGYSGIAVVGKRLFTMYADDDDGTAREFAAAFDVDTGQLVWRVALGEMRETQFGHGPRSTPTVDGDTVYVLDSSGNFAALAANDGRERWKLSLTESFDSEVPYWGFSTSALVDGDLVIVEGGGKEGKGYAALKKKTGEVAWTAGNGPAGYNSPLLVDLNGKSQFVYILGQKLAALDSRGRETWSYPWPQGETHAMPVFVPPNRIFASGVEGVGATLVAVSESGENVEVDEVWKNRFVRNHFSSSVLHDGNIYGFDNATLKCIAVADAELAWAKRGLGKGSLIYADGKLIVLSDRGQLLLVEATPEGYKEKASVQALEGRCWTAPSLAGGRLYLRNHEEMVSYKLKG